MLKRKLDTQASSQKIFSTPSRGQRTKNLRRKRLITGRMGYLIWLKGQEYTWLILYLNYHLQWSTVLSTTQHSGSFCSRIDTCSTGLQRDRCAASDKYRTRQHWGHRAAEQGVDFCSQPSQHSPSIYSGAEFTRQLESSLNSRDN